MINSIIAVLILVESIELKNRAILSSTRYMSELKWVKISPKAVVSKNVIGE